MTWLKKPHSPDGLVTFITSSGTLDKIEATRRELFSNTFAKAEGLRVIASSASFPA
jgi:hypothetical protein